MLLDTVVVSELRRSERAHANVVAWAETLDVTTSFLSAITVLEIETGILLIARRDRTQGRRLQSWLDDYVLLSFASRILPVDVAVARRCARLHVPDPRPERDAMIAATALVHGLPVATRNVSDFEPMGVTVINPWD